MTSVERVIHSARLFLGPSDELFRSSEKIWVIIYEGAQEVLSTDFPADDEKLLTSAIGEHREKCGHSCGSALNSLDIRLTTLDYAATSLIDMVVNEARQRRNSRHPYHHDDDPPNATFNADTPQMWTVDFDECRIFCDRDGIHLFHEFELWDNQPIRLRHFKPYIPQNLPIAQRPSTTLKSCSWKSAIPDTVPQQLFDVVYRIVQDYDFNWRNCGFTTQRYGIQQLAMGILSCFTLNFRAEKVSARNLELPMYSSRPKAEKLLSWRAWPSPPVIPTVNLGNTHIIFTEQMDEGMMLVNDHYNETARPDYGFSSDVVHRYIISSITEVQCFQKNLYGISCTPKLPFLDGKNPSNPEAVRFFLNAIHGHDYPIRSFIHNLPIELQEMVLDYVCGPSLIDRAIFGAILSIGVHFDWTEGGKPLRLVPFTTRPSDRTRGLDRKTHEHQILFWDNYVAMSYQAGSKNGSGN